MHGDGFDGIVPFKSYRSSGGFHFVNLSVISVYREVFSLSDSKNCTEVSNAVIRYR